MGVAIWCILIFIILMFSVLPIYVISIAIRGQKAIHSAHPFSRFWAGGIMIMSGIRWKVYGDKPRYNDTFIYVSNHNSSLDIPINAVSCPNPFRYLAKAELGKIPVLGWIIGNIYLLVDRGSPKARKESFEKMKACLERGTSVLIYPEGTRNKTSEPLARFYNGAFQLSKHSGVPIRIMLLKNTAKLQLPGRFQLLPGLIKVQWLPPLKAGENESVDDFKKRVKNAMLDGLNAMP